MFKCYIDKDLYWVDLFFGFVICFVLCLLFRFVGGLFVWGDMVGVFI